MAAFVMTDSKRVTASDREIGKRVRGLRKLRGMSQREVAHSLSISYQQLQKYERGQDRVPAARVKDLSRIFHATYEEILGPETSMSLAEIDQPVISPPMDRAEEKLTTEFRRIHRPELRQLAVRLVAELATARAGKAESGSP